MRPPPLGRLIVLPALALVGSNGKIAFESTRVDSDFEIWTVNPDDTGLLQLTDNDVDDLQPSWSPDGTKIAFARKKLDGVCNPSTACISIWVMNADGSAAAQITPDAANLQDTEPVWAPDGSTLLFTTTRPDGNTKRIRSVPLSGGQGTEIVASGSGDLGADWAPDGTAFVFQSNRDNPPQLYTAAADGTAQTKISLSGSGTMPTRRLQEASWSPDGATIAFRGAPSTSDNNALYVTGVDGSNTRLVYDPEKYVYEPSWSPNGAKVVVSVDTEGSNGSELRVVDAETGSATTIASSTGEERSPSWQPASGGSPSASSTSSTSTSPTASGSTSPTSSTSSSSSTSASPSPSGSPTPPEGSHVEAEDDAFVPAKVGVPRGGTVIFDFVGPSQHTATDATGMGLFDSGPVDAGGDSIWHVFSAAGRYPFVCAIHAGMGGVVRVPLRVHPSSGGLRRDYTITVASDPASGDSVHDLQVRRPGSSRWRFVARAFTATSRSFRPDAGDGTYRFRVRIRVPGAGSAAWSAIGRLVVG